jgi:3-oxoacyl-[acyl-carrier protein] reductase
MAGKLQDKYVLITGSGRGLGATLALGAADEGAHVAVHYNHSAEGAENVAAEIRARGRQSFTVQGDISKLADVQRIAETVFSKFGRLDALVNNVGDMAVEQTSWRQLSESLIDHVLAVDIKGTMFMVHEIGSRMLDQGSGSIVNIGSRVVVAGSPRAPQYAAAKYGILGITKSYALALAPAVRVNTLGPGFIETETLKNRQDWKTGRREKILANTPLGRIAQPADLVGPVIFLASEDSRHITGAFLVCDGGLSMVGA